MSVATAENVRSTTPANYIDPLALMRIKSLELRAKVVMEGFFSGLHRSPFHGFSVEFSEYRQYVAGDDLRYLDWKLFARSDRYYIKRFEDETNLRCHLLLDQSQSMNFGSSGYTKADYAATLCATLAYFLNTQRDAVGLMTFDDHVADYLPARYRTGQLRRLMLLLERPPSGTATDLQTPLQRAAEILNKRGVVVLVSDLLTPLDGLETNLGVLVSRGHDVLLFHLQDPAERDFSFSEPALFEDAETGRRLYVDPDAIREQYFNRRSAHFLAIKNICEKLGVDYQLLATDQPLELALFDFIRGRMARGRQVRRTVQRGSASGRGG